MRRRKHSAEFSETDLELMARAERRVRKMTTHALLDWADAAGSGMAKGFADYRAHGDLASLEDIALGVITLNAVVLQLKARAEI